MVASTSVGVRLASQSGLLLVVSDSVAKLVLVNKIVARVVRRVNVDHFDLAVVSALEQLQYLKVVTLNVNVVRVKTAILAIASTTLINART